MRLVMVTKAGLLRELTLEQLREIAIAENLEVPAKANKEGIIKHLLKLPMKSIRSHVSEYTKATTKPHRRSSVIPRILEQVPELLGVDVDKKVAKMTDDIQSLVKERIDEARLEDVAERLAHSMDELDSLKSRRTKREKAKTRRRKRPRRLHLPQEAEPEAAGTKVLPGRITTGYRDLDNLLFGGIPEKCSMVLTSASCDERELLVRRFLETGAKEGQTTLHVTIEASDVKALAEEYSANFYLLVCNPQADSIIGTLPNVFKLNGVENLNELNISLTSAFRKLDPSPKEPRRACIEIISDLLLQHRVGSVRKWLSALIPDFKSKGFTLLAVMNPYMHPPQEAQAILDLFEGEIKVYEKPAKKGLQKYLRITKLYTHKYQERELPLRKERLEAEYTR